MGKYNIIVAFSLILLMNFPVIWKILVNDINLHWFVYIPIHIVFGYFLAQRYYFKVNELFGKSGLPELLIVSLCLIFWMLPVNLDLSIHSPSYMVLKSLSMIFLCGFLLYLGFTKASFVIRSFFIIEMLATLFRVGWAFYASENRLCTSFIENDQRLFGYKLLLLSLFLTLCLFIYFIFGSPKIKESTNEQNYTPIC